MAIVLEAISHVFIRGRMITPGEVFSSDDEYGKKLIEGGSAKVHNSIEQDSEAFDNKEELRKELMELSLEDLKKLAEDKKVELAASDKTKKLIVDKLIDVGVTND